MPNNITEDITAKYAPKVALIVYQTNEGYEKKSFLECRPIKENGTLGVARPVSRKFMIELTKAFVIEEKDGNSPYGPMPENILAVDTRLGSERFVWWTPPGPRSQYFKDDLSMKDGQYNMPGCIYLVQRQSLYVFCFEGNRPDPAKKLLFGPFFNYYDDGRICLGSAKTDYPKDLTWKNIQKYWETLFWNSANAHMICNPMKEGINLTIALKESADKPFNTKQLRETNITLKSLLEHYGG